MLLNSEMNKIKSQHIFSMDKIETYFLDFSFISSRNNSANAQRAISFQVALSFAFSSPFRQHGVFAKRRSDRTKGLGVKGVETLVWFFAAGTRVGMLLFRRQDDYGFL